MGILKDEQRKNNDKIKKIDQEIEKLNCKNANLEITEKYENHMLNQPRQIYRFQQRETRYICNLCDETLHNSYALEKHMMNVHKKEKSYQCDKCEAKFLFGWKLAKHNQLHNYKNLRKCHYFNNGKLCPYMNDGCKFQHLLAEECKYGDK